MNNQILRKDFKEWIDAWYGDSTLIETQNGFVLHDTVEVCSLLIKEMNKVYKIKKSPLPKRRNMSNGI